MGNYLGNQIKDGLEDLAWFGEVFGGGCIIAASSYLLLDFIGLNNIPLKMIGVGVSGAGIVGGGYLVYKGIETKWYPPKPEEEDCKAAIDIESSRGFFYKAWRGVKLITVGWFTIDKKDAFIVSKTCRSGKKMVSYFGIPTYIDTDWKSLPPYWFLGFIMAGPFIIFEGLVLWFDVAESSYWWQTLGIYLCTTGFLMSASGIALLFTDLNSDLLESLNPLIGLVPALFGVARAAYHIQQGVTSSTDIIFGSLFAGIALYSAQKLYKNIYWYKYGDAIEKQKAEDEEEAKWIARSQDHSLFSNMITAAQRGGYAYGTPEWGTYATSWSTVACGNLQGASLSQCQEKARNDFGHYWTHGHDKDDDRSDSKWD